MGFTVWQGQHPHDENEPAYLLPLGLKNGLMFQPDVLQNKLFPNKELGAEFVSPPSTKSKKVKGNQR